MLQDFHSYGASLQSREIFLHNYFSGSEDENPGVDYRMSTMFIKNIRALERKSKDAIIIHMNSIGGEWADGMAIYDAICMSKCHVTIIVYGQAESMSSIIFQAADERMITENSYFMIHYGSTDATGDYLNVQNFAKYEQAICDKMIDIYANVCVNGKFFKEKYNNNTSSVKKYLQRKLKHGDWYMTAAETVSYGLADKVIKSL
jgi:ATP-dependent protease ClpP protease subunit